MSEKKEDFTTYVEETGNFCYIGRTTRGNTDKSIAAWQIKRVDSATSTTLIEWADGSNKFDKVWDDRAGYTYK